MKANVRSTCRARWHAYPEAYRLRHFRFQLFVTLTFRDDDLSIRERTALLFAWLRRIAKPHRVHFKQLMWLARYELGGKLGRGHYHLCIAGFPKTVITAASCRTFEAMWQDLAGARSVISLYDHTRDGVGYALKLPPQLPVNCSGKRVKVDGDPFEPTLSISLIQAVRRGRM